MEHQPPLFSQNIKTKGKMYFFDIRQAKTGNKYLSVTETRIKDGQKFRSTITVFPDHLQEFNQTMILMQDKIN